MSATFAEHAPSTCHDVRVTGDPTHLSVRLPNRLTVTEAGPIRRTMAEALATLADGGRAIVDMGDVAELDAAGLAAVTAAVFANLRRGCRITVLSPTSPSADRVARMVGVLPIGIG